jgi:metal-responsive CopG/Arc/MetJ family transcriptional regulator
MMATKVMVSFPDEFLVEVDRVAQEEHRSRSELVREALRFYIGLRQDQGQPGSNPFVRQAVMVQDRLSHATPGTGQDSTADVRRWREARG